MTLTEIFLAGVFAGTMIFFVSRLFRERDHDD